MKFDVCPAFTNLKNKLNYSLFFLLQIFELKHGCTKLSSILNFNL